MTTDPPQFLGRYRLLRVLGRGAMGVVYEAIDTRLGRTVAIKTVLRSFLADDATAADYATRFEREAQAAARLSHPNIVTVFDFGEQDDASYIVMEFVRGRDLAQVFELGEVFATEQIVTLMCELLNALGAAHAQGIVHRDVKPANVMLDASGHVKLADFGVARLVDGNQERTLPGTLVGTPSYMSPEQILGQAVGSRTDLFAAGVVLYQLLTGGKPFHGTGAYGLQRAILHDQAVRPSTVNASRPPLFDAVVERALAKDPEQRHASAAAFAAELQQAWAAALADQTVVLLSKPAPAAAAPVAGGHNAPLPVETHSADESGAPPHSLASATENRPHLAGLDDTVVARPAGATHSSWNRPPSSPAPPASDTLSEAMAASLRTAAPTATPTVAPTSTSAKAPAPQKAPAPAQATQAVSAPRRWWLGGAVIAVVAATAALATCSRPGAPSKLLPHTKGPSAAANPAAAQPSAAATTRPLPPAASAVSPRPPASGPAAMPGPSTSSPTLPEATPVLSNTPKPAPAPAKAPAARPQPPQPAPSAAQRDVGPAAATRQPPAPPRDARCPELLTRIQLGDTLTPEQTTFFHTRCAR